MKIETGVLIFKPISEYKIFASAISSSIIYKIFLNNL